MGKAMTAGELVAMLSNMSPDALVFIDNHGECRAVQTGDVRPVTKYCITTDDGEFEDYDGPALIISSWS